MKLEAQSLCFKYHNGHRQILNQVCLSIDSGERLGFTAPSGFGKTTLCKILAGYEAPDSGRVLMDGKPLSAYKGYCPVQMIWQHPEQCVNPKLRMQEVLKDCGGVESRILEGLGIEEEWMRRFPGELSGGELQRFCIARVLGEKTKFILADEITAMLDLITQCQVWNFLQEETERRGIGMLVVSHSESLLEQISTRRLSIN